MNIYLRELKAYRKSAIIWTLSLTAIVILFLFMYPAFTKDVVASRKALASLPAAVRQALDLSLDNFFTMLGFFSYILTFAVLAGAIQAMNLGTSIMAKEDMNKTTDFLLSKPVTRISVLTNKIAATLSVLVFTNIVFIGLSFWFAELIAKDYFNAQKFVLIALIMPLVQLVFLTIGTLLSVLLPKIKSIISVSLPTVFAFYIVGTLGAIVGNNEVRYISPFKFFSTDYIINHQSYELRFLVVELIIIITALTASYVIFAKKDIHSAT